MATQRTRPAENDLSRPAAFPSPISPGAPGVWSEQKKRLADRRTDPFKQWKISPIDKGALRRWDDYSAAREAIFIRPHSEDLPLHVVRADDKEQARLNVIRHLMARVDCPNKDAHLAQPDSEVVFDFAAEHIQSGAFAP